MVDDTQFVGLGSVWFNFTLIKYEFKINEDDIMQGEKFYICNDQTMCVSLLSMQNCVTESRAEESWTGHSLDRT